MNAEHCKSEIGSDNSAHRFYQVDICTKPSCSFPDFNIYGMRSLCKHILFVHFFALEVLDISILEKTQSQTHEVLNLLKKSNIDPAFKAKKTNSSLEKTSSTIQRDSQRPFQ